MTRTDALLNAACEWAAHGQGTRRQGLKHETFVNMNTGKFSRHAVSLISGKYKRGVQISVCPFCASILIPSIAEEVTVTLTAREAKP